MHESWTTFLVFSTLIIEIHGNLHIQVSMEMEAMKEEAAVVASMEKIGMKDLFKGDYAWPIFIAIMMMCGQQFSGINVAIFFSTQIFSDAGLGEGALYATLGMGVLNVAMTLVSVYLVFLLSN